jgi:hypothetical protein
MKWCVSMELWRETWKGRDQFDANVSVVVEADNEKAAREAGEKKALNPGSGKAWSHDRWAKHVTATKI